TVTNTTFTLVGASGLSSTWAIWARCGGQISGQCVYPKNSKVVLPSVSARKSNSLPSVSIRVKSGFGVPSASGTPWKGVTSSLLAGVVVPSPDAVAPELVQPASTAKVNSNVI